jgi:hypothetical protein
MRLPLVVGIWITAGVTVMGIGCAVLRPRANAQPVVNPQSSRLTPDRLTPDRLTPVQLAQLPNCQTVVIDPQPPLNVRSTPVAGSNNIVGTITNGTALKVSGGQDGWLQVQAPVPGWVYQDLTATLCQNQQGQTVAMRQPETNATQSGQQLIQSAHDRFQAGELPAAIALLKSIPTQDSHYVQAQTTMKSLTQQWQQSQLVYSKAQKAIAQQQWQVALKQVEVMPDVKYWRAKMAPIMQLAIQQMAV